MPLPLARWAFFRRLSGRTTVTFLDAGMNARMPA
jgi:hypothetical protein